MRSIKLALFILFSLSAYSTLGQVFYSINPWSSIHQEWQDGKVYLRDGSARVGTLKFKPGYVYRAGLSQPLREVSGRVEFRKKGDLVAEMLSVDELIGFTTAVDSFRVMEEIVFNGRTIDRDFLKVSTLGAIREYVFYQLDYVDIKRETALFIGTDEREDLPIWLNSEMGYIYEFDCYGFGDRTDKLVVPGLESLSKIYFGTLIQDHAVLLEEFKKDNRWHLFFERYVMEYNQWAKSQE